ncbi:asparaginase [Allokutzneria albata]|uniref:asparaginase n=1 Tax=Allokutzneria albata TaxID=211114 RepID=UPI001E4AE686|nr:asparaginase [Allokutzneria albata]
MVEVVRSGVRECVHHGSVIVLGPAGEVVTVHGDTRRPIMPRSSNKPVQALGMLRCGLDVPDDADLALICASHNGEPEHVDRATALLAKHGLSPDDLLCPPDYPVHEGSRNELLASGGTANRISMNCSGKHAGMLATCVQRGWPTTSYTDPSHPLQVTIRDTLAELAEEPIAHTAVDGCGAPLFSVSLYGLARAFGKLARAEPGSDLRRVADAMRAHPHLVAGTGREDTLLMNAVPGLLCKAGAEGVHAAALPDGRAVALKIADGAQRARMPVIVGALRALGVSTPALEELAEEPVRGGGRRVGSVRLLPNVF